MPFVRKHDPKDQTPETQKIFIGREHELQFFTDHILKPDDPAYNIVSIFGDGGVGKSTLLQHLMEEMRTPTFRGYCLVACIDERQATAASMMEKFAEQLRMIDFKRAIQRYKEAVRRQQNEEETIQDAVLQHAPDFAGAAVEGVPFVGPILREGLKLTTTHLAQEYQAANVRRETAYLEDPIGDLTRAFIMELNRLAETEVAIVPTTSWLRRRRRILLFFDTFEQLAAEAAPWLLDYFLPAEISSNIVLVAAGRVPLDRSLPDDPKRWLPYHDSETIYYISLNSFSEAETRAYLARRDITDTIEVETIWHISRGLPLYLSLLTFNAQRSVDPTTDVVANFLRWIPEHEAMKRRLVLDAALFSLPFNQDDLAAFPYIEHQEQQALYRWLVTQPFVQFNPTDGHYSYHDLAADLFSRHLYQSSPGTYYATRRALVQHYRGILTTMQEHAGNHTPQPNEWLVITLALTQQLFLLPDTSSHSQATEYILQVFNETKQEEEINRILRELAQEQAYNQANEDARQWARLLLNFIEAEAVSLEELSAGQELLRKIALIPTFPRPLKAHLHSTCGLVYRSINSYQAAIEEFSQAIADDASNARAYGNRGITYREMKQYEQALSDFNEALERDTTQDWVYAGRGEVHRHLRNYKQAIDDFDQALSIDPDYAAAYAGRGRVYRLLKEYNHAIEDFDRALSLEPGLEWAYVQRAEIYRAMKEPERALEDYNHAIALNPGYFWAYGSRGFVYFTLGDFERALADYNRAIELNPSYAWGYAERGRIYRHLHQYERSIADLNRAIALDPQDAWAYSHRGLTHLALDKGSKQQAITDFDLAIALAPFYGRAYSRRATVYLDLRDLTQATRDFARNCELEPFDTKACWMLLWTQCCQQEQKPDEQEQARYLSRLRDIIERSQHPRQHGQQIAQYLALVCRALHHWLQGQHEQAHTLLSEARVTNPTMWDAHFWYGLLLCEQGQDEGSAAIKQALKLGMFPVLLFPLRWLQSSQPQLYEERIASMLRT